MKKLLKQLLVLTLIIASIGFMPADAYARRFVYRRPASASATYTFIASQASVFGTSGGTTATLDTTGANFIVVCLWDLTAGGQNLSDNKSNSYSAITTRTNLGQSSTCFYETSPTVGTGHTWTTTSRFVGVGVLAMYTSGGSPTFDQESGNAANSSGNIQPGSLTPTVNNSLIITAFGTFNGAQPSMPTGYTQVAANTTSTAEGGGMGYKIQTTASAENPTWSGTGSSQSVNLAIFKP